MKIYLTLVLCLAVVFAKAQSGTISGTILDEKKEPLMGAIVQVLQGGIKKGGAATDIDGIFVVKPLPPGRYDLKASYAAYKTSVTIGVIVSPDKTTGVDIHMELDTKALSECVVTAYKVPLIDKYSAGGRGTYSSEEIEKMPMRSTESVAATPSSSRSSVSSPTYNAGSLTSGEVNDFSKWKLWEDIAGNELKDLSALWNMLPKYRYVVLVKNQKDLPVINAKVVLKERKSRLPVWSAITDNTGKAELWDNFFLSKSGSQKFSAGIEYEGGVYEINKLQSFEDGINIVALPIDCKRVEKLDIAFIVDATGSMQDEINYLKAEVTDIIQKVKDSLPTMNVRTGAVFYRDLSDEYLTVHSQMQDDINATLNFIKNNNADGGGDFPEGVDAALGTAIDSLEWREDAVRVAFLLLDAPPHDSEPVKRRLESLTRRYAQKGIRLVPVACSGTDKPTEYVMRSMALATNGSYVFLTNHSGIGNSHIEPTTDKYEVEYVNQLIYRIIYQFSYMPDCNAIVQSESDTSYITKEVAAKTDSSTSIDSVKADISANISWEYYPNPTSGVVNIKYQNVEGEFYISDISGKLMMRSVCNKTGQTTLDLSSYPSGTYFVKYQYGPDKWLSGKLVVAH